MNTINYTLGNRTGITMDTDDSLSQQNRTGQVTSPMTRPLRKNTGSRPDWLLYTVPGLAFVVGTVLFFLLLKIHKRRTDGYYHRDIKGCSSVKQAESSDTGLRYLTKAETQSYENVSAAIYNNQEGVCFYVPKDNEEDYVTPDDEEDAAKVFAQSHPYALNLPGTLTEGESYENMEDLYAHPRKRQNKSQEEDDDYMDPDAEKCQGGLHFQHEQTDTDSYENMEQNFAAHQQHSDDYINPDIEERDSFRLRSCPQDNGYYYTEDSYVSMEDNITSPLEDEEWN